MSNLSQRLAAIKNDLDHSFSHPNAPASASQLRRRIDLACTLAGDAAREHAGNVAAMAGASGAALLVGTSVASNLASYDITQTAGVIVKTTGTSMAAAMQQAAHLHPILTHLAGLVPGHDTITVMGISTGIGLLAGSAALLIANLADLPARMARAAIAVHADRTGLNALSSDARASVRPRQSAEVLPQKTSLSRPGLRLVS